jgi:hypothetical protein
MTLWQGFAVALAIVGISTLMCTLMPSKINFHIQTTMQNFTCVFSTVNLRLSIYSAIKTNITNEATRKVILYDCKSGN